MPKSAALYTTIYPQVAPFILDWCTSVERQDNCEFDLWVGLDGITADIISSRIDSVVKVYFVFAERGETPIALRNRALLMMVQEYDKIILADSDDILEPSRIKSSLENLDCTDVYGCALGLIDGSGNDLETYFGLLAGESPDEVIPRNNFLGFSNTAWRSEMLQKCLPAPTDCIAMDWILATRAWGLGARITFDRTVRMRYRQYGENTARVIPPFSAEQIIRATSIVREHYRLVLKDDSYFSNTCRLKLEEAYQRVEKFNTAISSSQTILDDYIIALNQLPAHRLWWLSVAHPQLETIWNP